MIYALEQRERLHSVHVHQVCRVYCSETVCSSMRCIDAAQCGHMRADISSTGLVSARDIGPPLRSGDSKLLLPGNVGDERSVCALDHTEKWM